MEHPERTDGGIKPEEKSLNLEETLLILHFASRMLAAELDRDKVVAASLEVFTDFGHCDRVVLLTYDAESGALCVEGVSVGDDKTYPHECIILDGPLLEMVNSKRPTFFPARPDMPYPLPGPETEGPERCLCVPLLGGRNKLVGMVCLNDPREKDLSEAERLQLMVLATVAAVSLENARLFRLAIEDELTGLYERRYFEIRLEEEGSRLKRHRGQVSVIFADIDDFKKINDTYGHAVGDRVLRGLADILRDTSRRGVDVVCRYGGEEFTVMLPATDVEGAAAQAERARQRCRDHVFSGPWGELTITVSFGVADMDETDILTAEELVRRADKMLYLAKDRGKNQVVVWPGKAPA